MKYTHKKAVCPICHEPLGDDCLEIKNLKSLHNAYIEQYKADKQKEQKIEELANKLYHIDPLDGEPHYFAYQACNRPERKDILESAARLYDIGVRIDWKKDIDKDELLCAFRHEWNRHKEKEIGARAEVFTYGIRALTKLGYFGSTKRIDEKAAKLLLDDEAFTAYYKCAQQIQEEGMPEHIKKLRDKYGANGTGEAIVRCKLLDYVDRGYLADGLYYEPWDGDTYVRDNEEACDLLKYMSMFECTWNEYGACENCPETGSCPVVKRIKELFANKDKVKCNSVTQASIYEMFPEEIKDGEGNKAIIDAIESVGYWQDLELPLSVRALALYKDSETVHLIERALCEKTLHKQWWDKDTPRLSFWSAVHQTLLNCMMFDSPNMPPEIYERIKAKSDAEREARGNGPIRLTI